MKNTELSVNISSDELPLAALHKVAAATRAHTHTRTQHGSVVGEPPSAASLEPVGKQEDQHLRTKPLLFSPLLSFSLSCANGQF